MYLEIRKHINIAEGTTNKRPFKKDIKAAIKRRGYRSSLIDVFYDDWQHIWRFTATIKALNA